MLFNQPLKLSPCKSPWWASSGHRQTILGHLLPSRTSLPKPVITELSLPDGDRLAIRYFAGTSDLIFYVFHGLGGDADADYMARTTQLCLAQGHSVYLVNHRGCGEGAGLARRPYHSGRGEDISEVVAYGRARHSNKRHLCIGFSLSANALLCLLTGLRGQVLPDFAIAVNGPIHLDECSRRMGEGFNRIYDFRFVRQLRKSVKDLHARGLLTETYRLPTFLSLRNFDSLYTAPASDFESRKDYYERCSTWEQLHRITIPTVILTAEDDPFIPVEYYRRARLSPTSYLHIEAHGGHMGYLCAEATPLGSRRWLDYALSEFIAALTRRP